jgi:superfamily II DNA helicase RecQ
VSLSQFAAFSIPCFSGSEEETSLNRFLRSRQVIQISRQLVLLGESARWSLLVEYQDASPVDAERARRGAVDYREILSDEVFARFRKLRDARKAVAAGHSVPIFAVFTNEQLAKLATDLPTTDSALMKIDGIGRGKCERFAAEFLPLLSELDRERGTTTPSG